ncbi:hypothetical protein M513_08206, partial [Trichuris suis]
WEKMNILKSNCCLESLAAILRPLIRLEECGCENFIFLVDRCKRMGTKSIQATVSTIQPRL